MRKLNRIIVTTILMIISSFAFSAIVKAESTIEPTIEIYWENAAQGKNPDDPIRVGDSFNLFVKANNVQNLYGYGINFFYDSEVVAPIDPEAPFDESVSDLIFTDRASDSVVPVNNVTTFAEDEGTYGNLAGKTASIYLDFLSGDVQGVTIEDGVIAKGTFVAKEPVEFVPRVSDRLEDVGTPEDAPIHLVVQLANDLTAEEGIAADTQAISYQVKNAETLKVTNEAPEIKEEVQGTLSQNAQPLSGVVLSAHKTDGSDVWYDTITDENGHFSFMLPDGSYQIDGIWIEEQQKWYQLNKMFTVIDGKIDGSNELSINLLDSPDIQDFNTTGKVLKGTDSVSGIWVSAHTLGEDQIWYDSLTDDNGTFNFDLPEGEYQIDGIWIEAESKWYPLNKRFMAGEGTETLTLDLSEISKGPIQGNVKKGNDIVGNVMFSFHTIDEPAVWYDVQTDAEGNFQLQELQDGDYQIDGIWIEAEQKWYVLEKHFSVKEGLIDEGLTIDLATDVLPIEKVVQGQLKNGESPLEGIWVSIHTVDENQIWHDTLTDANGSFTYDDLSDGTYQIDGIWVDSEQKWYPLNRQFTVVEGKLVDTTDLLIDLAGEHQPSNGNINGMVTRASIGLGEIIFSPHTTDESQQWYDIQTDANGGFTADLSDGEYQIDGIWVESESTWYPLNQLFSVVDGKLIGATELVIDILGQQNSPAGELKGLVVKGDIGLNDVIFSIHTTSDNPSWYDIVTGTNGEFKLNLQDGDYQIDGIWVDSESKWYVLNRQFSVVNGTLMDSNELTIDLTLVE